MAKNSDRFLDPATRLVTSGRDNSVNHGFVNPPVIHASTVLYESAADLAAHRSRYSYGRKDTPTSEALAAALKDLEGPACAGVALMPSGLSAIATALLSVLKAGDHLLVTDSAYLPTRTFCDTVLARFGVETSYYDPLIGGGIAALMRENTRAVFAEAPGSQSMDMPDIPALSAAAHARDIPVLMDNTWATPLFFDALGKGVDLSIQAGTKYLGGHSDLMLGVVAANAATWRSLRDSSWQMGLCVGPDDMFLALRGLRTLGVRLKQHQASAIAVARWLEARPEVRRVLYPALESDPGHAIWRRDFTGASGLLSVILNPAPERALHAFLDALSLFGMGFSWGGFESLVIMFDCTAYRTATSWAPGGPALRFHIGLEHPDDLTADLARGFAAMAAA